MAAQSLYRRYRSQRFGEIVGQQHVITALRNAVASGTEGHAYLFSGPRGTGKTSTARILAKALNCPDVTDGEPCGVCESCKSIEAGTSYDLFELDAASNNGVADMRDLVGRASVGSPGRTKVYILDEVHMLSTGASNALLKTLEEPPDHVCFVLATTDPQKVLPTIRSRTQHYDFTLLTGEDLTAHVRFVVADAGLQVDEAAIAHVVRLGKGSARDTLSALDQVVAAGGVVARSEPVTDLVEAIVERDQAMALTAVAAATAQGRDPRVLAEALLGALRDAFLSSVGADLDHLSDADRSEIVSLASKVGTATITRALEALGAAIIEMRQSPDPRVPLEVALLRVCDPSADTSMAALLERVERLERLDRAPRASIPTAAAPGSASAETSSAETSPPPPPSPRRGRPTSPPPPPAPSPAHTAAAAPAPSGAASATPSPSPADTAPPAAVESTPGGGSGGGLPSSDELSSAMADSVMATLRQGTKAIFSNGRFHSVLDGAAVFVFENAPTRDHAEKRRSEVEAALVTHFGRPIPMRLMIESEAAGLSTSAPAGASRSSATPAAASPAVAPASAPAPASPPSSAEDSAENSTDHTAEQPAATADGNSDETPNAATGAGSIADPDDEAAIAELEHINPRELDDATDVPTGGLARLTEAFPGAVVIEENP